MIGVEEKKKREAEALESMESDINRTVAQREAELAAYQEFYEAFDSELFELRVDERPHELAARYYIRSENGKPLRVEVKTVKVNLPHASIVSKESGATGNRLVEVEVFHKRISNRPERRSWAARRRYNERGTTKPRVAAKAAAEALEAAISYREQDKRQAAAMELGIAKLKEQYPGFRVERSGRGNGVVVTAPNNVSIDYYIQDINGELLISAGTKVRLGNLSRIDIFNQLAK